MDTTTAKVGCALLTFGDVVAQLKVSRRTLRAPRQSRDFSRSNEDRVGVSLCARRTSKASSSSAPGSAKSRACDCDAAKKERLWYARVRLDSWAHPRASSRLGCRTDKQVAQPNSCADRVAKAGKAKRRHHRSRYRAGRGAAQPILAHLRAFGPIASQGAGPRTRCRKYQFVIANLSGECGFRVSTGHYARSGRGLACARAAG